MGLISSGYHIWELIFSLELFFITGRGDYDSSERFEYVQWKIRSEPSVTLSAVYVVTPVGGVTMEYLCICVLWVIESFAIKIRNSEVEWYSVQQLLALLWYYFLYYKSVVIYIY